MFTIEQIKAAHGKVKTGADFPAYIREIAKLGVTSYETFVHDGHTNYRGNDQAEISSGGKYEVLQVSETADPRQFQNDLKAHQQGKTSFPEFCSDCANSGVEKWKVDIQQMTCTYFDKMGNTMLTEKIPG